MIDTKAVPKRFSGFGRFAGDAVPHCIDKDDMLTFSLERERRLLCTNGLLWVTIQNDRTDYLLDADRELDIPGEEKVVLEARQPSCFEID
ncbi:MAG: DUF2917 domain-containing protein [Rectinema sp.]